MQLILILSVQILNQKLGRDPCVVSFPHYCSPSCLYSLIYATLLRCCWYHTHSTDHMTLTVFGYGTEAKWILIENIITFNFNLAGAIKLTKRQQHTRVKAFGLRVRRCDNNSRSDFGGGADKKCKSTG